MSPYLRGLYTASKAVQSPRMTYRIVYTQFSAADAARITGISQDEQRDWRKRGFLPPIEGGKAKFDAKLLSGMLAAKNLSSLGIAPSAGWVLARSCGTMIFTRLMNRRQGVYDPLGLAKEDLVKSGATSHVYDRWVITDDGRSWGMASTESDLASHIGSASVVLDLDRLASQVVDRARKVLVTIERDD